MSLRKGLSIFILLAFGANGIVLIKSVDRETIQSLMAADKRVLLAALGLVFLAWACDSARFCALARAAHEKVSLKMGIVLTWLHYFGCAVTPMQSGGGPFQVYLLYKKGIPVGKGIAITLIRTMLTVLILSLIVPVAVVIEPALMENNPFIRGVIGYVFFVILCTWVFIGYTIVRPQSVKRFGKKAVMLLRRLKFLRVSAVRKSFRWLDREMDNYSMNFRLTFSSGFFYSMVAVALSVLHLLCIFSVLPVLMYAVGLPFNFVQTLLTQAVFMFVLYFIPTPGASGVAESGGAVLFGTLMPWNMAGIMAVIWRFFTEYISIFMGVVVVFRMLGWGLSEEVYHHSADLKKEAKAAEGK
ncbi:MAG: flippase-like domain-containing protein [Synergistaceae bacterium]|nr:flippase-like domain-containing protein [Synergistaceae bacterium]